MGYLILKGIHIVRSTVLSGTDNGLPFFFFAAPRGSDIGAIRFATRLVVTGDHIFKAPAGLVQLATGLALSQQLGRCRSSPRPGQSAVFG